MSEKFERNREIGTCIFCESFQILQEIFSNENSTLFRCERCTRGFTSAMLKDYTVKEVKLTQEMIRQAEDFLDMTLKEGNEPDERSINDLIKNINSLRNPLSTVGYNKDTLKETRDLINGQ